MHTMNPERTDRNRIAGSIEGWAGRHGFLSPVPVDGDQVDRRRLAWRTRWVVVAVVVCRLDPPETRTMPEKLDERRGFRSMAKSC
jgi:hypothetical protein